MSRKRFSRRPTCSKPNERAEYTFFRKKLDSGLDQTHTQLDVNAGSSSTGQFVTCANNSATKGQKKLEMEGEDDKSMGNKTIKGIPELPAGQGPEPDDNEMDISRGSSKTIRGIPELVASTLPEPVDSSSKRTSRRSIMSRDDKTSKLFPTMGYYEVAENEPEIDEDPTLGGNRTDKIIPDSDYWEMVEESVLGVRTKAVVTPSYNEEVPDITAQFYGNDGYRPEEPKEQAKKKRKKFTGSKSIQTSFRAPLQLSVGSDSPRERSYQANDNDDSSKLKKVHEAQKFFSNAKLPKKTGKQSSGKKRPKRRTSKKRQPKAGSKKKLSSTTTETSVLETDKNWKDPLRPSILKKKPQKVSKKSGTRSRNGLKGLLVIPLGLVERFTRLMMPPRMRLAKTAIQDLTATVEVYTANVIRDGEQLARRNDKHGAKKRIDKEHIDHAVKQDEEWNLLAHMKRIPNRNK